MRQPIALIADRHLLRDLAYARLGEGCAGWPLSIQVEVLSGSKGLRFIADYHAWLPESRRAAEVR